MRVRAIPVFVKGIPKARFLAAAAASARVDRHLAKEVGALCAMHYVLRVVVVLKGNTPFYFANFSSSSTMDSVVRVCATDTPLNCAL